MKSLTHLCRPELPYNQLPTLPTDFGLETRTVLKACIEARAALAELKQAAELIPNQTMLINTIPLLEAKDSSEIENIVTTTDRLFQYAQSRAGVESADPATKEAFRIAPRLSFAQGAAALHRHRRGGVPHPQGIRKLAEHTTDHVRVRLPRIYSRELVDVIFEQPYCRIGNLVEKGIAQRQAASRYLHDLADLGVLREMPFGKEKLFIHSKLMQLLGQDSNAFQAYT